MMSPTNAQPDAQEQVTILVIEDEPAIRDIYRRWLEEEYDVRAAENGAEAIKKLDETVDVVLLDRRLPDIAGEELLADIRSQNLDCRVAIVSTVEPDFDIIELGFDLYIEKPVTEPEMLQEAVATLLKRSEFDEKMQEFMSLASKKATLDATKPSKELFRSDEYMDLLERVKYLRAELRDATVALDDEDLRVSLAERD